MSEYHPLKPLLNIHLASDASATLYLPFVLDILTPQCLAPSAHLSKWTTRIQALLHSKEPGGRWAGLILAQKTVTLSQPLLMEYGQAWTATALLLLYKNDSTVVLKAAIRLLGTIFSRLYGFPEFRRQVAVPSIPKLLAALIPLVEQTSDTELKVVSLNTLVVLMPLYPTLHKPSYSAISGLALRLLDGRPNTPVSVLSAASRLYSVAHVSGGKVGASALWRKTFDETLAFGVTAFWSLRTTFGAQPPAHVPAPQNEDPAVFVPLQLDGLNCAVTILDDLLGATVHRPVQFPLGAVVRLALQLLGATDDLKREGFVDPITYALESSAIPKIQALGCSLVVSLVQRIGSHLLPHLTQVLTLLTIQIEKQNNSNNELRYNLLCAIEVLLRQNISHSLLIATRLMKVVLPFVSKLLIGTEHISPASSNVLAKGKKGKKKMQIYEGDELFSSARSTIYSMDIDRKVFLVALEVVRSLLRDPHLSITMQSVSLRVLIALQLGVVRIPPVTLSTDPAFHRDVMNRLHHIGTECASGTSSSLSKSLPLIITILTRDGRNDVELQRQLDLLIHPRLPPLRRPMPIAENISLVFSEEPEKEAELRESLGLFTLKEDEQKSVNMKMHSSNNPAAPHIQNQETTPPVASSAPQSTRLPLQPTRLQPPEPSSNSSVLSDEPIPHSKPDLIQSQVSPTPFRSSIIQTPKTQSSHSKLPQMEASASVTAPPAYGIPVVTVEDEDEEMPAIDLDSDSDLE